MLMVFAFAGCAKNGDGSEDGGSGELIYDFEQWMPDFSGTHISDTFGRVSLNTDAQFIAHGKGSAKIEPEGGGWMYIQTASDKFSYDNSDFSYVSGVQVKVYNATEDTMEMTMGFVTKVTLYDSFERIGDTSFLLASGWNTIKLNLPADILCYMADVKNVPGISFAFPRGVDSEGNQAVFYLDDIRLLKSDTENSSSVDDFPYDFAGYVEKGKLIAFEDDYSDQFFIHEKESEMAIVNALSEKNGQSEIIGLPDESKPEDDYVYKVTIDTESGWTESGGFSGKLLCDALRKFDAEVLNAPGARISFRIYATSTQPEDVVNRFIANFRFHPTKAYTEKYTCAGNYLYLNQWYDYVVPVSAILADKQFSSDAKVGTDLPSFLDNVTLYTCAYLGTDQAVVPYTFYISDLYLVAPKYETERGKLVNFQSDGSVDFIQRVFATDVSLVDATVETNANGEPITAPYADDEAHGDDKQVLKVEVPAITGDWEDTITIPVDMLKLGFDKFEDSELDENATITFKMYVTSKDSSAATAISSMRAWYNATSGQMDVGQAEFEVNTWHTFTYSLKTMMNNTNLKSEDIYTLLSKLMRFTFRGPIQNAGNDNIQVARTVYLSDFYINPAE